MSERWKLGKLPNRYGLLFLLLVADIAVLIALPADRTWQFLQTLMVGATLLLAIRTSRPSRRVTRFAEAGVAAAVALSAIIALIELTRGSGLVYLINAVLLMVAIPVVVTRVATAEQVTGRMVLGGLSAYLMIGLLFSFLFMGWAAATQQPFFTQEGPHSPSDFVYFSYITMATVGYGDLTPKGDVQRALAVVDGLMGQIFLVTAVARLVATWRIPHDRRMRGDEQRGD
jgi:hypothetical protein